MQSAVWLTMAVTPSAWHCTCAAELRAESSTKVFSFRCIGVLFICVYVCEAGCAAVQPGVSPALVVVGLIIRPQTEPEANRCLLWIKASENNYTTQLSPLLDKTNCLPPRTRTRSNRRPHIRSPFTWRQNSTISYIYALWCRQTDGHPHALCVHMSERYGVSAGRQMHSNATQLNILSVHH